MCIGTHSTFWNSVQVIKCPYSLFYVQNLIKNSLIYLLILDVLPIYFLLVLYSEFICAWLEKGIYCIFDVDFNMLNLEYERHHDSLIMSYTQSFVY